MKTRTMIPMVIALLAAPAFAGSGVSCFNQAQSESEGLGLPILLRVGVAWSESSRDFDEAAETDPALMDALRENVVLCRLDAERGEDAELAKAYGVRNYPTFILTNNRGDLIDQWYGFGCRKCFVMRLDRAVEEPVTIAKRLERFRDAPTEEDARKIAEVRHSQGMFAEAVAYFERARDLAPRSEWNYDMLIFNSLAYGNHDGLYGADLVKEQADRVFTSPMTTGSEMLRVASSMGKVASRAGDPTYYVPYLKRAVETTAGDSDETVADARVRLLPDYTLRVEGNESKAVELLRSNQPDGWTEDAGLLNDFAWWCLQNRVNMNEAEALARRAVDLAEPGARKAGALDTLAEIRNQSGAADDAVELIRRAIEEDPNDAHLREQLERFEEIVAARR